MSVTVENMQQAAPNKSYFQREPKMPYMLAIGLMAAGFTAVDQITNVMIPITCKYFTDSAFVITFLVSLNRLCGFTVGPFVAWKGDHLTTRYGSRRPFLMAGLPLTLVAMLALGSMPMWIQGEARAAVWAFALLCILNFIMQFFQDFNWGGIDPLYADTFRQEQLGRATGIRNYANQIVGLFMTWVAVKMLAPKSEFLPYLCAAGWLVVSFLLLVFVIKERPRLNAAPPKSYNPLKHAGMVFKSGDYIKMSLMGICWLSTTAVFVSLLSLFATRSLGISLGDFGALMTLEVVVTFALAFPVGYVVDRIGPKWPIFWGFVLFTLSCMMLAFTVDSYWTLFAALMLRSVGGVLAGLPMVSMLFQYAAPAERGAIYGAISFFRSSSAFAATWLVGIAVQMTLPNEAVMFVPQDINRPAEISQKFADTSDPFIQHLLPSMSPEVKKALADNKLVASDKAAQTEINKSLVASFNSFVESGQLIAQPETNVKGLSKRATKLLSRQDRTDEETKILNRVLLEDYFGKALAKSVNYRISYVICMALTIIAALVTLTMRRGKFSRTIAEAKEAA